MGLHYCTGSYLLQLASKKCGPQEVTYYRSRDARMEESKEAGGGSFYDRVYDADRPELFFKATAARTVGHGRFVRIRQDSTWDVPEPELTLFINSAGNIQGYTIGNDMSSRSIEEEKSPLFASGEELPGELCLRPSLVRNQSAVSR